MIEQTAAAAERRSVPVPPRLNVNVTTVSWHALGDCAARQGTRNKRNAQLFRSPVREPRISSLLASALRYDGATSAQCWLESYPESCPWSRQ
jgi:hypothetical protein